jgi:hypothetical protein
VKELSNLVIHLQRYVIPTCNMLEKLHKEGSRVLAAEAMAEEEAQLEAERIQLEKSQNNNTSRIVEKEGGIPEEDSSNSDDSGTDDSSSVSKLSKEQQPHVNPIATRPSILQLSSSSGVARGARRLTLCSGKGSASIQLCFTTLPAGCHNLELSFQHARGFLGVNACRNLEVILDGDEDLQIKGMRYWRDQLEILHETIHTLKDEVKFRLEDKRNFFSFVLTVVTVGLAPITILTSYW